MKIRGQCLEMYTQLFLHATFQSLNYDGRIADISSILEKQTAVVASAHSPKTK